MSRDPSPNARLLRELDEILVRPLDEVLPATDRLVESLGRSWEIADVVDMLGARAASAIRAGDPEEIDTLRDVARLKIVLETLRDRALDDEEEGVEADVPSELRREILWLQNLSVSSEAPDARIAELLDTLDHLVFDELEASIADDRTLLEPGRVLLRIASERADEDTPDDLPRLEEIEKAFWRRVHEQRPEERALREELPERLAEAASDVAEDILHRVDLIGPEEALPRLEIAAELVDHIREEIPRLDPEASILSCRIARTRLRRAIQNQRIRSRQIAQVGRRALRVIEFSILGLIVLVLGILVWPSFNEVSPETQRLLTWIDVGVCVLFLAEFSWRWAISRFSPRYFARCFFVDVLPSLPFGLLELAIFHQELGGDRFRVLRGVRGLRILRLVRLNRILVFAIRGMDRLVRRNAATLNREILFFSEDSQEVSRPPSLGEIALGHERRLNRRLRNLLAAVPKERRSEFIVELLDAGARRLRHMDRHQALRLRTPSKSVRLETLLRTLLHMQAEDVEDRLGTATAARLARILRLFDFPPLRQLPVLRRILPASRAQDPAQVVALAARGIGQSLERSVSILRFLGDLSGIITGPQLLDRLGAALVKMTQRPAVRLILLGAGLLMLTLVLSLYPSEGLRRTVLGLQKIVGTPLIVLGICCLVIQAFGRWLRRLAGEAGELFQKVAEAQGINLLKLIKLRTREQDLEFLFRRTLRPELLIEGREAEIDDERASFRRERRDSEGRAPSLSGYAFRRERVLFLYHDHLDGAGLHQSDVKSMEQLLGNLDIVAICKKRLGFTRKQEKQLQKLDLSGNRPLPTGPYLWFRFITDSLAEKAAKLILEYNQMAIPTSHLPLVGDSAVRQMKRWLGERVSTISLRERNEELLGSHVGVGRFTALDFLSVDPARDEQIRVEFGDALLQRLQEDRRRMIREVFGSYPFELLPPSKRSFNFHRFYFRWFGRGLFLVLPLRILIAIFVIGLRLIRRLVRVVKEQLHPERYPRRRVGYAPHDAAIRKINRMRAPIFTAALDLRTRFDPEYLGLSLPGEPARTSAEDTAFEDLALIGALESLRMFYRGRRNRRDARIARLERLLEHRGWPEKSVLQALGEDETLLHTPAVDREAMRAVTICYLVNYRNCRNLLHGRQESQDHLRELMNSPPPVRPRSRLVDPKKKRLFELAVELLPDDVPKPVDEDLLRGLVGSNQDGLCTRLEAVARQRDPEADRAAGLAILADAARYPMPWSQQLLSLRCVQSLTCLDIINTKRVVEELGGYAAEDAESGVALDA